MPWIPPTAPMININWDVAIGKSCSRIGLGVIARDCWGRVLVARSITKALVVDSATIESLATFQGMILGNELGANCIIFEGDAKQIVQAVNSKEPCNSKHGHLVQDIQEGMVEFREPRFNFI